MGKGPRTEKQRAHLERLHADGSVIQKMLAGRAKFASEQHRARKERLGSDLVECAQCKVAKPHNEYPTSRKNRYGEPRYRYCKPCHSAYQRVLNLRRWFSLTPGDYERMLSFQGGVCAICEKPPAKLRLAVDHNHKTGLIRGLLCAWCNRAIGQFRDDTGRVHRVMEYFLMPPCTSALGAERFGLKGRVSNKAGTRKRLNRKEAA